MNKNVAEKLTKSFIETGETFSLAHKKLLLFAMLGSQLRLPVHLSKKWEVKVRIDGEENLGWDEIDKEPLTPNASIILMTDKSNALLEKYPSIQEIQITNINDPREIYLFERPFE